MGVKTALRWYCIDCDESGEGPTSFRQATKHVATTEHSTSTSETPIPKGAK